MDLDNLTPVSCSCDTCVNMCKTAPCLGTRDDIIKIAKAGYGSRLFPTTVSAPIVLQLFGKPINLIAPKFDKQCTFLTEDNKCELHDKGLKPTEGKLAIHSQPTEVETFKSIIQTWL